MKPSEREKLCIYCEGRIPLQATICPFCASDQNKTAVNNSFQTPLFQHQTLEESLSSLYNPPYQGRRSQFAKQTVQEEAKESDPVYNPRPFQEQMEAEIPQEVVTKNSSFWPSLLLTAGANFLLLGLMLVIFSKNGILRLEWDARYWFYYCLFGLPFLYFGYRSLSKL